MAESGENIWVAAGTYKPGGSRSDTFVLVSDVALYGGFQGTETSLDQRDPRIHETILSGGAKRTYWNITKIPAT